MTIASMVKIQVDIGVRPNLIQMAMLSTMKIHAVILRTTALPKSKS